MKSALNARLLSAAEFTRQNATFADIGTDHAYLPLFLLEAGRIDYAYCCDINEGPLNSARANASECGWTDKIDFILTDGATFLQGKGITDYAICGMGGELIADIIDRAPHLMDGNVNLILQPMTRQEKLRTYLASHGFRIHSESYSFDAGKYYVCILASYDGKCREISAFESIVGDPDAIFVGKDNRIKYLTSKLRSHERAYEGKREAGSIDTEDGLLIERLRAFINELSERENI